MGIYGRPARNLGSDHHSRSPYTVHHLAILSEPDNLTGVFAPQVRPTAQDAHCRLRDDADCNMRCDPQLECRRSHRRGLQPSRKGRATGATLHQPDAFFAIFTPMAFSLRLRLRVTFVRKSFSSARGFRKHGNETTQHRTSQQNFSQRSARAPCDSCDLRSKPHTFLRVALRGAIGRSHEHDIRSRALRFETQLRCHESARDA